MEKFMTVLAVVALVLWLVFVIDFVVEGIWLHRGPGQIADGLLAAILVDAILAVGTFIVFLIRDVL